MNAWNASAEHCQPCANFTPQEDYYGMNRHSCYAPFDGTSPCDGTVSFCENCNKDHHAGGYETCKGSRGCMRNHPKCVRATDTSREDGEGPAR
jgi:hypothetical protein